MTISMLSYGIHNFKPGDIDTFIDIGAESGSVSAFIREELLPSRIIALEPCKENFENLIKTNEEMGSFMECYNVAYGSGEDLLHIHKRSSYSQKFSTEEEWKLLGHGDNATYAIESKTLEQIFIDYDIDVNDEYIIKMDCEGCERFLLDNEIDIFYIGWAAYFAAELHFFGHDFDGTPKAESNKHNELSAWMWDNFSPTHDICIGKKKKYTLQHSAEKIADYLGRRILTRHVRFIRKDWVRRFKN
jgi:FkbM family methyltransferase